MKKIINIYILLSSIFMLKLNGQGIFDRNDSLKIEIVKPANKAKKEYKSKRA